MTDQEKINRISELKILIDKSKNDYNYFKASQLGFKLIINGSYGAFANPHFVCSNSNIANAITAHGRDVIQYMLRKIEHYFYYEWHLDKIAHEKLEFTNVKPLDLNPKFETTDEGLYHYIGPNPCIIYGDTDSESSSTITITDKMTSTIEELYNRNIINGSAGETLKGHESVNTDEKVLNWSEENKLYYAPIKRIIRHKVTKEKWSLKTKTGKEIIVTNDHSLIVFRNGIKLEVKPREVLKTDKILIINKKS
jgi:DNA polymerase elongation subunit (family B)